MINLLGLFVGAWCLYCIIVLLCGNDLLCVVFVWLGVLVFLVPLL